MGFDADATPPARKKLPAWWCWECFGAAAFVAYFAIIAVVSIIHGVQFYPVIFGGVLVLLWLLNRAAKWHLKKIDDDGG